MWSGSHNADDNRDRGYRSENARQGRQTYRDDDYDRDNASGRYANQDRDQQGRYSQGRSYGDNERSGSRGEDRSARNQWNSGYDDQYGERQRYGGYGSGGVDHPSDREAQRDVRSPGDEYRGQSGRSGDGYSGGYPSGRNNYNSGMYGSYDSQSGRQYNGQYGNQQGNQYGSQHAGQYDGQSGGNRSSQQGDGYGGWTNDMNRQGRYNSGAYGNGGSMSRGGAMQGGMQDGRSMYSGMHDGHGMGQHAGKGPKGWQRSDDRLKEEISEALARHPDIDASEIEVQVKNGEVTLAGSVCDRDQKRQAEDAVEQVFGANEVQNQLRVKPENASVMSDGGSMHKGGEKPDRNDKNERGRNASTAGTTGT